jgi:hypothetical protein
MRPWESLPPAFRCALRALGSARHLPAEPRGALGDLGGRCSRRRHLYEIVNDSSLTFSSVGPCDRGNPCRLISDAAAESQGRMDHRRIGSLAAKDYSKVNATAGRFGSPQPRTGARAGPRIAARADRVAHRGTSGSRGMPTTLPLSARAAGHDDLSAALRDTTGQTGISAGAGRNGRGARRPEG